MGVIKGVLSNGAANVVQKIVRILDQLLLVPFFLTSWGAAYYGEWLTLSIIPSVLAFSDLGFGSAVSNSFVLAYAAGDKQTAANLRKSGFWIITASVILGALITVVIMMLGKSLHLFDKSLIDANSAIIAVAFLIASKLITFYNQLAESFYRATRRAAYGSFIGSTCNVLNILVGFCVLISGGGVVEYAFSQFVIAILFAIYYYWNGNKLIDLKNFHGTILEKDIKMIVAKGMGYLMTPIWQSIYFQGGTFVVRIAIGAEAVAVFNTVRTVCRSVNQLFSIINGSIFPDLQFEYGRGNMQTVHRLFRVSVLISIIIGFLGTMCLALFGKYIYEWWTHGILSVSNPVWNTFMLGVLLNAVWWTSVVTYRMTNQPYHFAIMSTIAASLSVAISYGLSLIMGLLGAAIGTVVYDLIMAFYVLPDSCKILGMNVKDLVIHVGEDYNMIKKKIRKEA